MMPAHADNSAPPFRKRSFGVREFEDEERQLSRVFEMGERLSQAVARVQERVGALEGRVERSAAGAATAASSGEEGRRLERLEKVIEERCSGTRVRFFVKTLTDVQGRLAGVERVAQECRETQSSLPQSRWP
eukprot:TRINITY_DN17857_c0_g1_i2.p1 TRINITY_DN17857_c0_g1~~TRINITY_DN17857_c0_g1_i2.p1  ORF type:complete len:132 (+),score=16.87 TRINITY_DN17857_c0_g1_i2:173-568(+)